MYIKCSLSGIGLWLALTAVGTACDPKWPCPQAPCSPSSAQPGSGPMANASPTPDQAAANAFAQAPAAGTGAESSGNPNIMGDYLRASSLNCFTIRTTVTPPPVGSITGGQFGGGPAPFHPHPLAITTITTTCENFTMPIGGGPLKIGENENVRPQDRVFLNYNGYSNILPGVNGSLMTTVASQNTPVVAFRPNADLGVAGFPVPLRVNYQYETAGFEKTFLDGNASLGVRVPLFQLNNDEFNGMDRLGDVSVVGKLLLYDDATTGDAVCSGLAVTFPTGMLPTDLRGHKIHSYVFQPYYGMLFNVNENVYIEGFNSLAVPTTREDATIMFFDVAVGYWLYRGDNGDLLTGIVPTSEVHVNWPWTNRGEHNTTHAINVPSSVDLTEGVHFRLGRATLGLGVSFCVSGPKLYDYEGVVQFNWNF